MLITGKRQPGPVGKLVITIGTCFFKFQPPVHEVCLNYEVVMFQPRTGASPDLGSLAYCCVYSLVPPFLFISPPDVRPRGKPTPDSCLKPPPSAQSIPAPDHHPRRVSPVSVPVCQTFPDSLAACRPGSCAHLCVAHPHPSLASPHHPSLPNVETSSSRPPLSLPLPDFCRRALVAAKIFSMVSLSCALGTVCLHQGLR